jgi:hypothetical protein
VLVTSSRELPSRSWLDVVGMMEQSQHEPSWSLISSFEISVLPWPYMNVVCHFILSRRDGLHQHVTPTLVRIVARDE